MGYKSRSDMKSDTRQLGYNFMGHSCSVANVSGDPVLYYVPISTDTCVDSAVVDVAYMSCIC